MQAWPVLSLCAVLALPPASTAQARWVTISHAGGQRIEIDTADVGLTSSLHFTLWWRVSYSTPRSDPRPAPSPPLHWSSFVTRQEIDCHAGETRSLREILYNAAGDVVNDYTSDTLASSSWESPPPDSIVETMMRWACKHF